MGTYPEIGCYPNIMSYLKNDLKLLGGNTHMCLDQVQNRARQNTTAAKKGFRLPRISPSEALTVSFLLQTAKKSARPSTLDYPTPDTLSDLFTKEIVKSEERTKQNGSLPIAQHVVAILPLICNVPGQKNYINAVHMMET